MSILHVCVCYTWMSERDTRSLRTDDFKLSCGCWESNPGPLVEKPMLFLLTHLSSPNKDLNQCLT